MQEFKCPCCDGAIEFDAASQKPKCPYCGTEFEVEALSKYNDELNDDRGDQMEWETTEKDWTNENDPLGVYTCNSCGGEIVAGENTVATSCPYCGDAVVFSGQLSGMMKPDLVIPFKLDKKTAVKTLKKHYEGKILLPKAFKEQNHIEEVKGIYVPFWLYDTESEAHIRYKATKTRIWSDSHYNYTETSHYSIVRGGSISFEDVPVDGSSKIDNVMMESLEPFDTSTAVDFQTAYLAGFFADKYDVDSDACAEIANARIKKSTEDAFRNTVIGYNTVITASSSVKFKNAQAKYALLPVWMLSTKWNGQSYSFAINGQTGKLAGNLPMDKRLYMKWLFGLTLGVGILTVVASYLLWLF